ncbi:hypothetical protein [Planococcus lenghuensis]|uniref:Uncharacterized protein n=1 Tax=Planococcus lenghuensis TaxID=2213202 RepID=A0A1Q2L4G7_9BACL|nr:hypothetical protein [Planococcus lenghuensis]AQQ55340.1 hypothetical protein B0X71_19390 [Planococcus lenghuensis]
MRKSMMAIPLCSILLLTGCLPKPIAEEVEKAEQENEQLVEQQEDTETDPEDVELSEEQKEVLTETEAVTPEEAAGKLSETKEEVAIKLLAQQDTFDSSEKLAQYVSHLFFLYHKGDLGADKFYDRIRPHLHENFLSMLPDGEELQRETFENLQAVFRQHLKEPIESYQLTSSTYSERAGEAMFYRKYELANDQQPIYYQTVLIQEGSQWLLFDDSPAPPVEITPVIEADLEKEDDTAND